MRCSEIMEDTRKWVWGGSSMRLDGVSGYSRLSKISRKTTVSHIVYSRKTNEGILS